MFVNKRFDSVKYPGEYLDYLYYQPANAVPAPLMLYAPGAGCRGTNLKQIGTGGFIENVIKKGGLPARIIIPQCRFETWFDCFHILCEFLEANMQDPTVDRNRVYLTGVSMGAYAIWQLCISHPEWITAAVPVCGGGMYWDAGRLKDIPIWAFHGQEDDVVLCCESQHMVERINETGGNAKLTLIPAVAHNAWDYAYSCEEMWQWLFSQKKPN